MKLARLLGAWTAIAAIGYCVGLWLTNFELFRNLAPIFLKGSSIVFGAASGTLGFVFKQLDSSAPKEFDEIRQERWDQKLDLRWRRLWIRWWFLLLAAFLAYFCGALADKPDWGASTRMISLGIAASFVGLISAALSVYETFWIRRQFRLIQKTLKDRARKGDLLHRLRNEDANQPVKHA